MGPLTLSVCSRRIIELNGGQSPLTYKRFQTLISRMEAVEVPAESITAEVMGKCTTPLSDDHDDKFGVPSLEELGEWRRGETAVFCKNPSLQLNFFQFSVQVLTLRVCPRLCGLAARRKPSRGWRGTWRGR